MKHNKEDKAIILTQTQVRKILNKEFVPSHSSPHSRISQVSIERVLKQLLAIDALPLEKEKPGGQKKASFIKFLGQMINVSGYVSDRPMKAPPNLEAVYQLEYWNQKDFLYLHTYSLTVLMARLLTHPPPTIKHNLIALEILYAVNAYRVMHRIDQILDHPALKDHPKKRNAQLRLLLTAFVDELMAKRAQIALTMIFPCGYQEHAIYLNIIWLSHRDQLLVRLDNVGEGSEEERGYHRVNTFFQDNGDSVDKVYPCVIGVISRNSVEDKKKLVQYLMDVSLVRKLSRQDKHRFSFDKIYNKDEKSAQPLPKFQGKYRIHPIDRQQVNNCVYKSYEIGMRYRMEGLIQVGDKDVFNWLFGEIVALLSHKANAQGRDDYQQERAARRQLLKSNQNQHVGTGKHRMIHDTLMQLKKTQVHNEALKKELSTYIPINAAATRQADEKHQFDLMREIKSFIDPGNQKKALLLLGDAGAGKTLFTKYLCHALWKSYQVDQKHTHPIPLWISLPMVKDPVHNLISRHLQQELHFERAQIPVLKEKYRFIIVLDGFDEINGDQNLYDMNQLKDWKAKVIVTCRRQYLGARKGGYEDCFIPHDGDEKKQYDLFEELHLMPFSDHQIKDYLERAVKVILTHWSAKKYWETITKLPDLKEMIRTPFILRMIIEALPQIVEHHQKQESKSAEKLRLTRFELYQAFTNQAFERQKGKLLKAHQLPKQGNIVEGYMAFCTRVASLLYQMKKNVVVCPPPKYDYFNDQKKQDQDAAYERWKFLFGHQSKVRLLRKTCPLLKKSGPHQWQFLHKSLLEFFISQKIFDQAMTMPELKAERPSMVKPTPSIQVKVVTVQHITRWKNQDLNQQLLVDNPNTMQLLADIVKKNPKFKAFLFQLVYASKRSSELKVAAANAISILNAAHVSFSNMDFSRVRVPYADLSFGMCDHTNFSGANLTGVRFRQAWLRRANLSHTCLKHIDFAERPYLNVGSVTPSEQTLK